MLAINLTTSANATKIGPSTDLGTGVIDRFRTLPIWKPSVLVGRSLTDLLSAALCAAIVMATGFVVGWRPDASLGSTVAGVGIFLLFSYAVSWGCACLGLVSQDAESAQGLGLIILFPLAFVSNALVPTAHMPAVLRTIANWNPVSAVTTAARQLFGNPNPSAAIHAWPMQHPVLASLLWSVALLAVFAPLASVFTAGGRPTRRRPPFRGTVRSTASGAGRRPTSWPGAAWRLERGRQLVQRNRLAEQVSATASRLSPGRPSARSTSAGEWWNVPRSSSSS